MVVLSRYNSGILLEKLGWEFALMLFALSLKIKSRANHSHSSFLKSNKSNLLMLFFFQEQHERFTLVALYKRATVSDSLRSLFTNKQCEQFAHIARESLVILANHSQKTRIRSKFSYFSYVFYSFSPFICPRANRSHSSLLLIRSFLKSNLSDLLPSLLTKEQLWAFCSHHSLKKRESANRSKKRANHTFAHLLTKNQAIRSKNQTLPKSNGSTKVKML